MKMVLRLLITACLVMVISYFSYVIGFYHGSSKSILFEQFLAANINIHAINYIKTDKHESAISFLNTELESNMNAINDIHSSNSNLIELVKGYSKFKELVSYNSNENVALINKKYKNFINKYSELKAEKPVGVKSKP